ncbi:AbrB/MazE/SpoVT family DNA-binding domain-containing protein [bacterium]|nr:AbrB/MazE/SpoVT family DNA-binding domain-containing protein [bacterium]
MPESHLTSKGQITLPKAIRDHLKVKSGDVVSFSVESDGRVTVSAVTAPVTSLKGMVAAPTLPVTLEEMQQAVRKRFRG